MSLSEKGFQTGGNVVLPGIKEKFRLSSRIAGYRYDPAVDDLAANWAQVNADIAGQTEDRRGLLDKVLDGAIDWVKGAYMADTLANSMAVCSRHRVEEGPAAYVLAKRKGLAPSLAIFADGYLSGSFLEKVGGEETLQRALYEDGVRLDLKDHEIADAAGLLALRKAVNAGVKGIVMPDFKGREIVRPQNVKVFGLGDLPRIQA